MQNYPACKELTESARGLVIDKEIEHGSGPGEKIVLTED